MHKSRIKGLTLTLIAGIALCWGNASAGDAEPIPPAIPDRDLLLEPIRGDRLYLRTGVVDTSQPRRGGLGELAGTQPDSGRYVIQLDGPMTPNRHNALANAGVVLEDYLPANAWVVDLRWADPVALNGLGFVRWHAPFDPDWKLDPEIGLRHFQQPERARLAANGRAALVVTMFRHEPVDLALRTILDLPDAVIHWIDETDANAAVSVEVDMADAAWLAELPFVQYVEEAPDITFRNNRARWVVQSNQINVTPMYDQGLRGEGQLVGVLDSRVNVNHCSFADSAPIGPDHRKIEAYNTSTGSASHGTHVAGTVVGDAGEYANTRGVAYKGRLVFNEIPSFNESSARAALILHHEQGARIHTNSWGDDSTTSYTSLARGFDSFAWDHEDSLSVLAVTNRNDLRSPENAKNLLAVGATEPAPDQHLHCTGGDGPTSDGRRKPEIYAPGCSTRSSDFNSPCGTRSSSGTSMATPAVAGVAMIARQYFMEGFYPTGLRESDDEFTPTGALIKATLLNSAVDMTGVPGYPSNREGWGRVLIDNTLFFEGDDRRLAIDDVRHEDGLITGDVYEIPVDVVSGDEDLRFTLVWTDPPAGVNASFAAVNDLDLEVIAPNQTVYLGNNFSGGYSVPGGEADDRNNVEQVHIQSPQTGTWTVRVHASAVNVGPQGFAMAASGDLVPPGLGVRVSLESSIPELVTPGESLELEVRIREGNDTLISGSPTLHFRVGTGEYEQVSLTPLGDEIYRGEIPALPCGDDPRFYFSAEGVESGEVFLPANGPDAPYRYAIGELVPFYIEHFDSPAGWTAGVPGDDATSGHWEWGNPIGTFVGGQPVQPSAAHSGLFCFFTGQHTPGEGPGFNDVDHGRTTLLSPELELSGFPETFISYYRWYSNDAGFNPNSDIFEIDISNDGGETWTSVEVVGPEGDGTSGGWVRHEFSLVDKLPPSDRVVMRFIASDEDPQSLVEAAIDTFEVRVVDCQSCPADLTGNGEVDISDFFLYLDWFENQDPRADLNGDGQIDVNDFFKYLEYYEQGC